MKKILLSEEVLLILDQGIGLALLPESDESLEDVPPAAKHDCSMPL